MEPPSAMSFIKAESPQSKRRLLRSAPCLGALNQEWQKNSQAIRRIIQVNSWYKRKIQVVREIWILSPIVHKGNVVHNTTVPNKRNLIINPKRHCRALKWLKRSKLQFWTSSTLRFRVKGSHWLAAERHLEKRAFQETFTSQIQLTLKPKWHL